MVAGHGSQVPVDGPLQCERADLGVELDQAGDLVGVSSLSRQETMKRGSRGVVEPPRALPDLDPAEGVHDRLEAVVVGA